MAICNKQHRYLQGFNELPEAQDNRNGGRHICAACAYEEGLKMLYKAIPHNQIFLICPIVKPVLYAIRVLLMHIISDINLAGKSVLN